MSPLPSSLDADRHPVTPVPVRSHLPAVLGAGLLLAGHYGLAGATFGRAQWTVLALLFTACAVVAAAGLRDRRAGSATRRATRRRPAAWRFVAMALATSALVALAALWIGEPSGWVPGPVDTVPRWSPHGYAIPLLVATFVALPLLTAAWLCLAVMELPAAARDRRGRGPDPEALRAARDEDRRFDRWIEADFSTENDPAAAAPPG